MVHYIGKRLLIIIPLLLVLSVVVFVLIQLPPGDYLTSYINTLRAQGGNIDQDTIQQLEMRYGLDQPMYIQYFKWMGRMFQGDFGYSFQWNRPVNELLADRLPCTIALSFTSILLVWIIALPIGFYSATHKYSPLDYGFTTISFLGMSLPDFLLALIVLWLYYAATGTFGGGLYSDAFVNQPFSFAKFVDLLKHVWMPYLVIAITSTAGLIKTFRANLLDEMSKPYVQTARAKGVSNLRLLNKYPVRISLFPFVSTIGWMLPGLISGQTIISIVMNLPTVGPLLLNALKNQDMYLAGSIVFILGVLTMIGTLISDILLALTDPRIRRKG